MRCEDLNCLVRRYFSDIVKKYHNFLTFLINSTVMPKRSVYTLNAENAVTYAKNTAKTMYNELLFGGMYRLFLRGV
jgi:hypothetical protein